LTQKWTLTENASGIRSMPTFHFFVAGNMPCKLINLCLVN